MAILSTPSFFKHKNFFIWSWFDKLKVGDVFRLYPSNDKYYKVIAKNEVETKFQTMYGKLDTRVLPSNMKDTEVLIFTNR